MSGNVFKSPSAEAAYMAAYEALLALWNVDYESVCVNTRLGLTHVLAAGDEEAPPVVLLPGLSVSAAVWFASAEALSRTHRVYAVDIIGDVGKSVLEHEPQHRSEYAFWLKQVFDALNIYKPALVGYSYGGWLALNLASTIPEAVQKVVLVAPASGIYPFHALMKLMLHMTRLPGRQYLQSDRKLMEMQAVPGFQLNDTLSQMMDVVSQQVQAKVLFPGELSNDELMRITAKTLLLVGEKEILYDPVRAVAHASQFIPHIQAEIVPDAGHLLLMEKPDVVNDRILSFIADAPLPVFEMQADEMLLVPEYI